MEQDKIYMYKRRWYRFDGSELCVSNDFGKTWLASVASGSSLESLKTLKMQRIAEEDKII